MRSLIPADKWRAEHPHMLWHAKHQQMFRTNQDGYRSDVLYAGLNFVFVLGFAGMMQTTSDFGAKVYLAVGVITASIWMTYAYLQADRKLIQAMKPQWQRAREIVP